MTDRSANDDGGDDLDARLSALGGSPLPPLPGAVDARQRGRRRTRRARAALGAGGAVVALLAVTAVAVVGGGGGPVRPDDSLAVATSPPTRAEGPVTAALLDPADLREAGTGTWSSRPTDDAPFAVLPADCGDDRLFTTSAPRNGDTGRPCATSTATTAWCSATRSSASATSRPRERHSAGSSTRSRPAAAHPRPSSSAASPPPRTPGCSAAAARPAGPSS